MSRSHGCEGATFWFILQNTSLGCRSRRNSTSSIHGVVYFALRAIVFIKDDVQNRSRRFCLWTSKENEQVMLIIIN